MLMSNKPVPPTLPMSVRLEAQQWNIVLGAMGKAPYEIIAQLIEAVQQQLQMQATAPLGNGLDHPAPPQEHANG